MHSCRLIIFLLWLLFANFIRRVQSLENKGYSLPKLPHGLKTADYDDTANYHWDFFVRDEASSDYSVTNGPFQFGKAILLQKSQCQTKTRFLRPGDACMKDMRSCSEGFSMSVFVKISYNPSTDMLNSTKYKEEYLMSTGGGDVSQPGAGIYMKGANLGALVSLGNEYWHVMAKGFLPLSDVWTNVGITWERPMFTSEKEYLDKHDKGKEVGGLALFVDGKKVAYSLLNRTCSSINIQSNNCTEHIGVKPTHDPPQLSLGCVRTPTKAVHFLKRSVYFDEPALWNKALKGRELAFFSGGYKRSLEGLPKSELMDLLEEARIENLQDLMTASSILNTLIHAKDPHGSSNNGSADLEKIIGIINKLLIDRPFNRMGKLGFRNLKVLLKSIVPLVSVINLKGEFASAWRALHSNSSKPDSHQLREHIESYILATTDKLNAYYRIQTRSASYAQKKDWFMSLSNGHFDRYEMDESLIPDFVEYYSDGNFAIQVMSVRVSVMKARSVSQRNQFKFPIWSLPAWEKSRRLWGETVEPAESVNIPLKIRDENCVSSVHDRVNFVMSAYDTFPGSENKNPSYFNANKAVLVSRIISLKASHVPFLKGKGPCPLGTENFNKSAILVTLSHRVSLVQSLVFKKNPSKSLIKSTKCAIWNENVGINGAWDVEHIHILYSDKILSNCIAHKLGVYAIIAELYDEQPATPDPLWLRLIKYFGHFLSIVSLGFFIGKMLWSFHSLDMFHCLSLSLGLALIGGHLVMVFSELEVVRNDLNACLLVGSGITLFYVSSAVGLLVKSYALFEAITEGIIGGRTRNYLMVSWGSGVLTLGVLLALQGEHLGLDPVCMISSFADAKWIFFMPMIFISVGNVFVIVVSTCNVAFQAVIKDNIADEIESMTKGCALFSLVFVLTWCWSPLAFIPDLYPEGPDFYPAFQVFNSLLGTFFFILDGLSSNKNRILLHEGVKNKRAHILKLAKAYTRSLK